MLIRYERCFAKIRDVCDCSPCQMGGRTNDTTVFSVSPESHDRSNREALHKPYVSCATTTSKVEMLRNRENYVRLTACWSAFASAGAERGGMFWGRGQG